MDRPTKLQMNLLIVAVVLFILVTGYFGMVGVAWIYHLIFG